jgi:hypothetical protein
VKRETSYAHAIKSADKVAMPIPGFEVVEIIVDAAEECWDT